MKIFCLFHTKIIGLLNFYIFILVQLSSNQFFIPNIFVLVTSAMTENNGSGFLTTLHIPFVAVRTPSDESNRSSSFNSNLSKYVFSTDTSHQNSSLSIRTTVRKTVKNFFRSSKTIDNLSNILTNGNNKVVNISKSNRSFLKLKSSSYLSHSQPIVTANLHYESQFIDHNEQTPLIEHQKEPKQDSNSKISLDNTPNNSKKIHLNRQILHLPLDIDYLHRSHSCNDGITIPSNIQAIDLQNPSVISNLQTNNSEAVSLRSSDSTASSLSAYLSAQQQLSIQETNIHTKNEINKSQESIFSCSSPIRKEHSIKSLIMAATAKDKTKKQDNDVLLLIANWVLRSPEDFQGIRKILPRK